MVVKRYRYHGETIDADELEPIDPDLLEDGYEMVNGEPVEMPNMGAEASWVASEVHYLLQSFLKSKPIGVAVTAEFSYKCFPKSPGTTRKPDVSVILCDPATFAPTRVNYLSPPALVVEVLSESNTMGDITDRIDDFFSAGTSLVWVIDPVRRFALIQRPDNTIRKIFEAEELSGETLLPGFTMKLSEILPRNPSTN